MGQESSIESGIRTRSKRAGWKQYKFVSPGTRGGQDRLFIRRARVVFIEVKRPGKEPTLQQSLRADEFRAQGIEVDWCDNADDAMEILEFGARVMGNFPTASITGGSDAWDRKDADFYPTPPDVTQAVVEFLDLPPGARVVDPACGEGDMAWVLEASGLRVWASDLHDRGYGEVGIDYLTDKPAKWDAVITNPPFKNHLPEKFCRKALAEAPIVAMLLKATYWHARGRMGFFKDHPPQFVLPLTWRPAFLEAERGSAPLMDCIWVVWDKAEREARLAMTGGIWTEPSYRPITRPTDVPDGPPVAVLEARLQNSLNRLSALLEQVRNAF